MRVSIGDVQEFTGARLSGLIDEFHTDGRELSVYMSGNYDVREMSTILADLQKANCALAASLRECDLAERQAAAAFFTSKQWGRDGSPDVLAEG